MNKLDIQIGDCFELIRELPDNSVDLVVTSPPYSNIISYGKNISVKKPDEYVNWLLPLFNEIYRVLKPSGSFILNINDTCSNGLRNTFIYELIYRSQQETNIKFYDTYIWHKKNGIPNGSKKRFRNTTEFIFHFVKDPKQLKFYMDRVLEEPKETYVKRFEDDIPLGHGQVIDGERIKKRVIIRRTAMKVDETGSKIPDNVERLIPLLVRPDNVFRFSTAGKARDNTIKHPAPFYYELPLYFINLLTDEGDLVLDVFSGIGTTGLACNMVNRDYLGYELNEKYAEFSVKRLKGDDLDEYVVCQYDLDGNFIAYYNNPSEACKKVKCNSFHHILTCYRGFSESYMGYKWTLEPKNKYE